MANKILISGKTKHSCKILLVGNSKERMCERKRRHCENRRMRMKEDINEEQCFIRTGSSGNWYLSVNSAMWNIVCKPRNTHLLICIVLRIALQLFAEWENKKKRPVCSWYFNCIQKAKRRCIKNDISTENWMAQLKWRTKNGTSVQQKRHTHLR